MTSVHPHPHPLAQKYVKPNNLEISKRFGIVRIEDWHDRVRQETWLELRSRGDLEAQRYDGLSHQVGDASTALDVVLCHTQSTGESVLLHDAWVKDGQIIA